MRARSAQHSLLLVLTLFVVDLALLLSRVVGCDLEQTLDVSQQCLCGGDAGVHSAPNPHSGRNRPRRCRRRGKRRIVDGMLGVATGCAVQTADFRSVAQISCRPERSRLKADEPDWWNELKLEITGRTYSSLIS